jgi:DNA mismatch repair protein MutS
MAGLPGSLIERAREILLNLEMNELSPSNGKPKIARRRYGRNVDDNQLNLFTVLPPSELEKQLSKLDTNHLTPIEALQKLDELKRLLSKDKS